MNVGQLRKVINALDDNVPVGRLGHFGDLVEARSARVAYDVPEEFQPDPYSRTAPKTHVVALIIEVSDIGEID